MATRTFDPESESEHEDADGNSAHDSAESGQDDEALDDQDCGAKKVRRTELPPKDFTVVEVYDRQEMSDDDIMAHIRRHLYQFNKDTGILQVPGAHRDRNDMYGDWIFRRKWISCKGLVTNIIVDCPLRKRCGCSSQCKIVQFPTQTSFTSPTYTPPRIMCQTKINPSFSRSS